MWLDVWWTFTSLLKFLQMILPTKSWYSCRQKKSQVLSSFIFYCKIIKFVAWMKKSKFDLQNMIYFGMSLNTKYNYQWLHKKPLKFTNSSAFKKAIFPKKKNKKFHLYKNRWFDIIIAHIPHRKSWYRRRDSGRTL